MHQSAEGTPSTAYSLAGLPAEPPGSGRAASQRSQPLRRKYRNGAATEAAMIASAKG